MERFRRQLKNSLRARLAGPDWYLHLPWVLLGLRIAPKEISNISSAESPTSVTIQSLPLSTLRLLHHYEKVCRSKDKQVRTIKLKTPTVAKIGAENLVNLQVTTHTTANPITIAALPDTGAEIDAIPENTYKKMFQKTRLREGSQPMTVVGTPIITIGVLDAEISWGQQHSIKTIIHVLRSLSQPVISKMTQISHGMLPSGYSHRQIQKLSETNTNPFSHLMAVATEKKAESEPHDREKGS